MYRVFYIFMPLSRGCLSTVHVSTWAAQLRSDTKNRRSQKTRGVIIQQSPYNDDVPFTFTPLRFYKIEYRHWVFTGKRYNRVLRLVNNYFPIYRWASESHKICRRLLVRSRRVVVRINKSRVRLTVSQFWSNTLRFKCSADVPCIKRTPKPFF